MPRFNNHARLIGRIGTNPELRFLTDGTPTLRIRLYLPPCPSDPEPTPAFQLVAFGRVAERISGELKKNDRVLVEGTLRNRRFMHEGQTHLRTDLQIDTYLKIALPAPVNDERHHSATRNSTTPLNVEPII